MKLDDSLLQRAVPNGSMRYFAWLYAPVEQRDVLAASFLIETELHETAQAPHEVAHIRLQWWREEFEALSAGKARHPATLVLQAASARFDAACPELSRSVLHAAAQELANATYETDAELSQYLRNGLGSLFAMAAQLMTDAPTASLLEAATQLGAFVRQVEITRDLHHDFHHGRLYLPLATLDELGIEYEALQGNDWPVSFVQLIKTRSEQQLAAYQRLIQGLSRVDKQSMRPLLVLSELHARMLQNFATDPVIHTKQRLELSPLKKTWVAWRAAYQAR